MTARRFVAAAIALTTIACTDRTSAPLPVEHYDKPLWTASGEIVTIGGIRVLSDGRVFIADFKEKEVWLFSAEGKALVGLTHHGSGPGEFQAVRGVWPLPGDSTLIYDDEQRRLLVLDEYAKPVQTIAVTGKMPRMAFGSTVKTDRRGRIVAPAAFLLDSNETDVPLIRWDWVNDHLDTLARVAVLASHKVAQSQRSITWTIVPFSPADWFHPLPDGGTMIVRAVGYRVDLIDAAGAQRHGDTIPFTPIAVSDSERNEEDPPMRKLLPATKPPFDGYYAVVSNDGEAWIRRIPAPGADSLDYDVLNAAGKRVRIVRLPKRRWVLAVTRDRVYISRYNQDDFEVLDAFTRK